MSYKFTKQEQKELEEEFKKTGFPKGEIISQFDPRVWEIEKRVLERHGKYSTEFLHNYEMFKGFKNAIITFIIFSAILFIVFMLLIF